MSRHPGVVARARATRDVGFMQRLLGSRTMPPRRSKNAVFVFIGKRGHTLKVLWWDGTGTVLLYKRLDASTFEIPKPREAGATSVVVSEATFEALFNGLRTQVVH
jgi:hypothetical protein